MYLQTQKKLEAWVDKRADLVLKTPPLSLVLPRLLKIEALSFWLQEAASIGNLDFMDFVRYLICGLQPSWQCHLLPLKEGHIQSLWYTLYSVHTATCTLRVFVHDPSNRSPLGEGSAVGKIPDRLPSPVLGIPSPPLKMWGMKYKLLQLKQLKHIKDCCPRTMIGVDSNRVTNKDGKSGTSQQYPQGTKAT